jgi:FMN phosphatase YigB (HAD superfamily)
VKITHIFFDLHGTLVDGVRLHPCYSVQLGRVLSERYGGAPAVWVEANQRIMADWDNYYADLDLTRDRGIDDMWEGMIRTTRALFRLAGAPMPDIGQIRALSRELPGLVTRSCNALYPEARPIIEQLCAAGYMLGVTSHAVSAHARGLLRGGGILQYFAAPIIGPDVIGRFDKDAQFYTYAARKAGVSTQQCLAIDDSPPCVAGAKAAGMGAVLLSRRGVVSHATADHVLTDTLLGLLDYLDSRLV